MLKDTLANLLDNLKLMLGEEVDWIEGHEPTLADESEDIKTPLQTLILDLKKIQRKQRRK